MAGRSSFDPQGLRLNIAFHPEAVVEARAARMWYAERSPAAAEAFMHELDVGIERIVSSPEARPIYVSGTRRYLFRYFPFAIVYRTSSSSIEVIAVAHGRRRPGYWKDRLNAD